MFNILIIILGSNINFLLNDRVSTVINFMNDNHYDDVNFELFLTGGNKDNNNNNEKSEAEKMLDLLNLNETGYYIDDVSTNTVENFCHINDLIKTKYYEQIIICTSEFHYKRAKKISDYFIENNNVGWILSKEKLDTSYSDENFHYKNIEKDIEKLKNKLELN